MKKWIARRVRHRKTWMFGGALLLLCGIGYYFALPEPLFEDPVSTVLFDEQGALLGAKIARDGQWRFPARKAVPEKFAQALICFEDKRFYRHWGIDIWALGKAVQVNIQAGRVVRGGSTLSMQVMRMMRKGRARNLWNKAIEAVLATRLEWRYSKEEILALYASHAPFGGNVVGLDAAAWKYFERDASTLSWAESAMLAVLPNSPSLIHLSKNRGRLKAKRDQLLYTLYTESVIDSTTYALATLEALPEGAKALPRLAPHLLEHFHQSAGGTIAHTTLTADLQQRVNDIVDRHYFRWRGNEVHNAAALVVEVKTGAVKAYVGNAPSTLNTHSAAVDIVRAPRSTGSILKPFLYAALLHEGQILPQALFPDVPSYFGDYTPENFDRGFDGAVAANKVISRSLNIPSVFMLYDYGVAKFHAKLKQLGMTTLTEAPTHYGLSLILGGAEATLWDLARMYRGMAHTLGDFYNSSGATYNTSFVPPHYLKEDKPQKELSMWHPLSASAVWYTFEAMQEVVRPGVESFWKNFTSSSKIAWKTGTSFGFRDAWAVGCTPEYVVAVWVGNADGEGRPGLVGVRAAGPLLFDIFHILNLQESWFDAPFDELDSLEVCAHSGHLASMHCGHTLQAQVPERGQRSTVCSYCKPVHLDVTGAYRVHSGCVSPQSMRKQSFFVLPPNQEWFYKSKHPDYIPIPPYRADCMETLQKRPNNMAFIYPSGDHIKIYIPKGLNEARERTVFRASHRDPTATVYWHLDETFIRKTKEFHELAIQPKAGKHVLTLVDEYGTSITRHFEILEEE